MPYAWSSFVIVVVIFSASSHALNNKVDRQRFDKAKYVYPCIPVMGVGVISDPNNYLVRLIRSVDFCVKNFVLVHANGLNVTNGVNSLYQSDFIHSVTVVDKKDYIFSVANGWNTILKSFPKELWYAITAYDVFFLPNQLEILSQRYWIESGWHIEYVAAETRQVADPNSTMQFQPQKSLERIFVVTKSANKDLINFVFVNWKNMEPSGYNFFVLDSDVIREVGYFDENIFPAFYEDNDWNVRVIRWGGVRWTTYVEVFFWHGAEADTKYVSGTHLLKERFKDWSSIKAEGTKWNMQYLMKKWGCPFERINHNDCLFQRPFNNSNFPLSYWKLDKARQRNMMAKYGLSPKKVGNNRMREIAYTSTGNIPNISSIERSPVSSRRIAVELPLENMNSRNALPPRLSSISDELMRNITVGRDKIQAKVLDMKSRIKKSISIVKETRTKPRSSKDITTKSRSTKKINSKIL